MEQKLPLAAGAIALVAALAWNLHQNNQLKLQVADLQLLHEK